MCRRFPWDGCWVWVQPGLSKCGLLQKYCSELVLCTQINLLISLVTRAIHNSSLSKTLSEYRFSGCLVRVSLWFLCCRGILLGGRAVWRSGVLQLHWLWLQVEQYLVKNWARSDFLDGSTLCKYNYKRNDPYQEIWLAFSFRDSPATCFCRGWPARWTFFVIANWMKPAFCHYLSFEMTKTKCTAIRSVLVIFATAAKYAFDVGDL